MSNKPSGTKGKIGVLIEAHFDEAHFDETEYRRFNEFFAAYLQELER